MKNILDETLLTRNVLDIESANEIYGRPAGDLVWNLGDGNVKKKKTTRDADLYTSKKNKANVLMLFQPVKIPCFDIMRCW